MIQNTRGISSDAKQTGHGTTSTKWPKRLYLLDASRGVASLAVVLWHWQHFAYIDCALPADFQRNQQPLYGMLKIFYNSGSIGVEYFFALSGFIFFWIYSEAIRKRMIDARKFFIQRFSRLYPLHFITLIVVALLQLIYHKTSEGYFVYPYNDSRHFLLNLLFASHWGLESGWSFNAPSWSVSVEVLIYAAFFVFCLLKQGKARWCMGYSMFLFVINNLYCHSDILRGISAFLSGGASFYLTDSLVNGSRTLQKSLLFAILALWAFVLITEYTDIKPLELITSEQNVQILKSAFATYILFPLSIASMALLEISLKLDFKGLGWLGNTTYSSYMLHFPLQISLAILAAREIIEKNLYTSPIWLAVFLASLLTLSHLCYKNVEMPLQRAIRAHYKI